MTAAALATIAERIEVTGLTPGQIDALRSRLSYPNPAHAQALRLGHVPRVPERLSSLVLRADGVVEVPRGCTAAIREVAPCVRWVDLRLRLSAVPFPPVGGLRPYQRAAVDAAVRGQQGTIVAPTGAGKTEIGCGLIASVGQPAIVLVPALDLAAQWRDRIRSRLALDPGMCVGGEVQPADVMVATLQSLRDGARLSRLAHDVGLVLVDEAHHVAADTFARIVEAFPARWRIGLTATPERPDGLGVLLRHVLGRELHRVHVRELADAGHLLRPQYVPVPTDFEFAYGGADDWQPLLAALVEDGARNELIVRTVRAHHDGTPALVLTGRVQHAEHLAECLCAASLRAAAIHGSTRKRDRAALLERARAGDLDVLVGTTVADEGLDVPALARVFLTFPARSEARLVQRIGRVVRPHPGKAEPTVFDLVDERVGPLRIQARRRAASFARVWRSEAA